MNNFLFTSEHLGFSTWTKEDIESARSLWGNKEVMHFLSSNGIYSERQIQDRLRTEIKNDEIFGVQYWKLYELESDKFIGCCGLKPVSEEKNAYELGFQLLPAFWGKSYGCEAANFIIRYAFTVLKASNLYARHHPENTASAKLLNKLGFSPFKKAFYEPTGLMHPFYSYFRTENIQIEGSFYSKTLFTESEKPDFADKSLFHQQLYLFLKEWFSDSPTLSIHTSGSTGIPKDIVVRKIQMLQSAKMTCDFFGLGKGDKILLCLPLDYIAGKMIVVRALYAGLDIYPVEPTGHPLTGAAISFDFAAMIPLQVYNTLQIGAERQRLSSVKHLIIGGGAIDETLEKELKDFPNAIYSTYGMTETLSHIALRRISGSEASSHYIPLSGVKLSLSTNKTLVVDAPLVSDTALVTNDIVELHMDGRFRILGRVDNVINTGGVKVQIEEVERNLRSLLRGNFAITCIPHPKLGEAVVLLTEHPIDIEYKKKIEQLLPRYQQPQHICTVPFIPQTGNGKTDRAATKKLAMKRISLPDSIV